MAIAHHQSITPDTSSSNRTVATVSINITSGTDLTLVVMPLGQRNFNNIDISSVTYDGTTMTQGVKRQTISGAARFVGGVYYLDNPSTGSSLDVVVTFDSASIASAVMIEVYSGANNGIGTNTFSADGNSSTPSASATTGASDSFIVASAVVAGGDSDPFSIGGDLDNERQDGATGTNTAQDFGFTCADGAANAASDTASFTATASDVWILTGIELNAAAVSGSKGNVFKSVIYGVQQ